MSASTTGQRPPRDNLVRAIRSGVQLRESTNGGMPTLRGHFAVFGRWARIESAWEGVFMEQIARGAFTKTMQENRHNIRVLFDHGHDPSIGNKPLGPLEALREDAVGGYYEVPMLDTAYNRELLPGLKEGLFGASFRFAVVREDFVPRPPASDHNPDGLPERTLREVKLFELGPVAFPAYQEATAGVRSTTDSWLRKTLGPEPDEPRKPLFKSTQHWLDWLSRTYGKEQQK